MDRLWAPWRNTYISKLGKITKCIFCSKPRSKRDDTNYILLRAKYAYSMLNIFPYNAGHMLIAPYRHTADINSLADKEILEMIKLIKKSRILLDKILKPQGYNIGMNVGRVAGAGFDKHIHIHIVPRWKGDTNFISIFSDTKIISDSLDELYSRLKKLC